MPGQILIVDDERDIRQLLKEMLSLEGHEVTEASNGAEALAYLKENPLRNAHILLKGSREFRGA